MQKSKVSMHNFIVFMFKCVFQYTAKLTYMQMLLHKQRTCPTCLRFSASLCTPLPLAFACFPRRPRRPNYERAGAVKRRAWGALLAACCFLSLTLSVFLVLAAPWAVGVCGPLYGVRHRSSSSNCSQRHHWKHRRGHHRQRQAHRVPEARKRRSSGALEQVARLQA